MLVRITDPATVVGGGPAKCSTEGDNQPRNLVPFANGEGGRCGPRSGPKIRQSSITRAEPGDFSVFSLRPRERQ